MGFVDDLELVFDRSLVEAVQGIALSSGTFFVPFAQILEYFVILWFTTSLEMILKIDKKWYDCIKSHRTHLDMFDYDFLEYFVIY